MFTSKIEGETMRFSNKTVFVLLIFVIAFTAYGADSLNVTIIGCIDYWSNIHDILALCPINT